jgi:hypothetical protein
LSNLLGGHDIPQSVAGHNNKVLIACDLESEDVRVGDDQLLSVRGAVDSTNKSEKEGNFSKKPACTVCGGREGGGGLEGATVEVMGEEKEEEDLRGRRWR